MSVWVDEWVSVLVDEWMGERVGARGLGECRQ